MTMGWVAAGVGLVGVGTALYNGSQQADAAENAANTQANSANQANQLQYQMFQEQQKLMQPWVQSGQQNLDRLNYAMYGQAPTGQYAPDFSGVNSVNDIGPTMRNWLSSAVPGLLQGRPVYSGGSRNFDESTGTYRSTGTPNQMGVAPGGLNPDWRFSTQDWKNSPEYEVYNNARDAALTRSQDALMAQGAASGMYGSGTMANQLSQNMGQLYAQYDPLSLQTAQQNAISARQNQYNQMVGMASPTGAQQVGQWAGNYGQTAGANTIAAGNAQAAGQVGSANAWSNAMTSGVNQVANAYGQYQGQQNFNALMNRPTYDQGQYSFPPSAYGQNQQWMQNSMSDFGG